MASTRALYPALILGMASFTCVGAEEPGTIDITTFGARGNGRSTAADRNAAALREAVNAAPPGATVRIPRGTYVLRGGEQPLTLRPAPGVVVRGERAALISRDAYGLTIEVADRADSFTLDSLTLRNITLHFRATRRGGVRDVKLVDLVLHGSAHDEDTTALQVLLGRVDGATIERCRFLRRDAVGRSVGLNRSARIEVRDSSWRGRFRTAINVFGSAAGEDGSFPDAERSVDVSIHHNRIIRRGGTDGEDHGIYAWGMNGLVVADNVVRGWSLGPSGGAVKVRNGDRVRIERNRLHDSGIRLYTYDVAGAPPWLRDVAVRDNRIRIGGTRRSASGRRTAISYWRNFPGPADSERAIEIRGNESDGEIFIAPPANAESFTIEDNDVARIADH